MNLHRIVILVASFVCASNCQSLDNRKHKGDEKPLQLTRTELGELAPVPLTVTSLRERMFSDDSEQEWRIQMSPELAEQRASFWKGKLSMENPSDFSIAPCRTQDWLGSDPEKTSSFVVFNGITLIGGSNKFGLTEYKIVESDFLKSYLLRLLFSRANSKKNEEAIPRFLKKHYGIDNPKEEYLSLPENDRVKTESPGTWKATQEEVDAYPLTKSGFVDYNAIKKSARGFYGSLTGQILIDRSLVLIKYSGSLLKCLPKSFRFVIELSITFELDKDMCNLLSDLGKFPFLHTFTYASEGVFPWSAFPLPKECKSLRNLTVGTAHDFGAENHTAIAYLFTLPGLPCLERVTVNYQGEYHKSKKSNSLKTFVKERSQDNPVLRRDPPRPVAVEKKQEKVVWGMFADTLKAQLFSSFVDVPKGKKVPLLYLKDNAVSLGYDSNVTDTQYRELLSKLGKGLEVLLTWVTDVHIDCIGKKDLGVLDNDFGSFKERGQTNTSGEFYTVDLKRPPLYVEPSNAVKGKPKKESKPKKKDPKTQDLEDSSEVEYISPVDAA